jgi:hypothetical protein
MWAWLLESQAFESLPGLLLRAERKQYSRTIDEEAPRFNVSEQTPNPALTRLRYVLKYETGDSRVAGRPAFENRLVQSRCRGGKGQNGREEKTE